jgi:hypothetical protein
MTWLLKIRLALAVIGIVIWGYAVRVDDPQLRLAGIIMLFLSLVLRFAARRRPPAGPGAP